MADNNEIIYFRRKISTWSKLNYISYPWRETDNKWHSLVAEIMLQKTRAIKVLRIYNFFIEKYPDASSFISSYRKDNWNVFETLGLLKRYEMFIKMAKEIDANGMPNSKEGFQKLPGVGEYVSSAMMSLHCGKREIILDSNIMRFISRLKGFYQIQEGERIKMIKKYLERLVPNSNDIKIFNYSLLDFSMIICKPTPNCIDCPLKRKCAFIKKRRGL